MRVTAARPDEDCAPEPLVTEARSFWAEDRASARSMPRPPRATANPTAMTNILEYLRSFIWPPFAKARPRGRARTSEVQAPDQFITLVNPGAFDSVFRGTRPGAGSAFVHRRGRLTNRLGLRGDRRLGERSEFRLAQRGPKARIPAVREESRPQHIHLRRRRRPCLPRLRQK